MNGLPVNDNGYNRAKAVEYAHRWALERNPQYISFSGMGGDCANFASQCIRAGAGVMNYKPLYGWFYRSGNDRTPSWSGVKYLYNFLVGNKGAGPYAEEADIARLRPGDIIQLAIYLPEYHHTLVVVETGETPRLDNILIACHNYDSDNRHLDSYNYKQIRCLHILGVRPGD